ncbi:MAG: hypothetical protein A2219_02115 [Elusimicrobia bacterium RIFOXYA2_FULL_50_26]|nr:MAG: hypothetical protein A2219_02115 [Elusimicrobia bacterium RIFOXYA2_FULL_50_26]
MAKIKPFHGIRYNDGDISKFICPPYDIISASAKDNLMKASRENLVRIELPEAVGGANKYQSAARLFNDWRGKNVLTEDKTPALYFYEQAFADKGRKMTRRGFFAALRLENPHKGSIKPHEKTLSKPKEDRLKLIRAVRANISPIFGLFNDPAKRVVKLAGNISKTKPLSFAKDKDGVTHKLWRADDARTISSIAGMLDKLQIFIADGHHRYETAWNYSLERKKKDKNFSQAAGYNYVLIFVCPVQDPGLSIWPTHRVVALPDDFEERIAQYFNVLPAKKFATLSHGSPQPLLVYYKGRSRTLTVKNSKLLSAAMPDKCAAYRNLGVSILHSLLIPALAADQFTYVKSEKEARSLADKRNHAAIMVPSTPIEAMKEIALAGQAMPQKSTYFYPKVATGMVIHSLNESNV